MIEYQIPQDQAEQEAGIQKLRSIPYHRRHRFTVLSTRVAERLTNSQRLSCVLAEKELLKTEKDKSKPREHKIRRRRCT